MYPFFLGREAVEMIDMPKRTGPTNEELRNLIQELKKRGYKDGNKLFLRIARDLSKPTRVRRRVGLSRINRNAKNGDTVVVPGKVLNGRLEKRVNIVAWKFSASAEEKIKKGGGKVLMIDSLLKSIPKGIRIIG